MKKNIEKAGLWIFLVLMSVLMLFPIYFMVIASLKPTSELFRNGIRMAWQFDTISLENYQYTFSEKNGIYLTWYANSILVMIISTGLYRYSFLLWLAMRWVPIGLREESSCLC